MICWLRQWSDGRPLSIRWWLRQAFEVFTFLCCMAVLVGGLYFIHALRIPS